MFIHYFVSYLSLFTFDAALYKYGLHENMGSASHPVYISLLLIIADICP